MNLLKILAIKSFRITHQIHAGYASQFVKIFSSRLLRISTMFNHRFKVQPGCQKFKRTALRSCPFSTTPPFDFDPLAITRTIS